MEEKSRKTTSYAKNRTGNLPSKVAGQCLYHDVFSTYMRHFVQDDIYQLKDVIQNIMTASSLVPKRSTIGPLAQFEEEQKRCYKVPTRL